MILFNEYRSWSESNQSNCTTHGRKLERFSHAVYISRSEDGRRELSEGLRVIFGEYSFNAKISLTSPDFCTQGVGRYAVVREVSI